MPVARSLLPGCTARWGDLPCIARLLQRRLGPPARSAFGAWLARCYWLGTLPYYKATGALQWNGGAVMIIEGAELGVARRIAAVRVVLISGAVLGLFAFATATLGAFAALLAGAPSLVGFVLGAMASPAVFFWPLIQLCRETKPTRGEWKVRKRHRPAWQITGFTAGHDLAPAAGRMARTLLDHADSHGLHLVATPRTAKLEAVYRRWGFVDTCEGKVRVRPPVNWPEPGGELRGPGAREVQPGPPGGPEAQASSFRSGAAVRYDQPGRGRRPR